MKNICYILLSAVLLNACSSKPVEVKQDNAFVLSDTMLGRCEFYTASLQKVKNKLRLFGKIEPDNNKLARAYSMVGGVVTKINVELGDYVKKGQILAVVRSGEIAEIQKEKWDAHSNIAVAIKNLQVAKDMYEGKLASEKEVITAEKELEKAKAEQARMREVEGIYNLQNGSEFNIVAPMSGFIVQKDIYQNEQIRADKADMLFSIAEINEVWAIANVNETNISNVALGYDAEVNTLSFPDEKFKGKIDKIFNTIDPVTKAMKVMVRIPNPALKLKPEMSATVTVEYSEENMLVAVPASAIIFDKSKNWIMVYADKKNIETRRVIVHSQVDEIAYISKGLEQGEKVITKNSLLIYDALND